jgi:hypothetical protein
VSSFIDATIEGLIARRRLRFFWAHHARKRWNKINTYWKINGQWNELKKG